MPLPDEPRRCYALVPCAGVGARAGLGAPKQYHPVAGRPVVGHTLAALARVRGLTGTLVVLSPNDDRFESAVPEHPPAWVTRRGGDTRARTVEAGLARLRELGARDADWVLVHDAARCLIEPAWVERLIAACADDAVGGLLAWPLTDTLKQARDDRVGATLDREGKWAAQTPQMFGLRLLQDALGRAGAAVTDEAGAVEILGLAPRLVRGDFCNLKLTWPEDFALAERLLATRPT
jgi:2-C-methyl-D-erythritol 4-phosphate cytidylyltransferase